MEILLGPILFIMDVATPNKWAGIALTISLIPLMMLVAFRRRAWAALVSGLALLLWLFFGLVGRGITV